MVRKMVATTLAATCCGLVMMSVSHAQSLGEDQKSAVLLDINIAKLMDSELAHAVGLAEKLEGFSEGQPDDAPDAGKLLRFVASSTTPESIAAAQQIGQGVINGEFYARMQFSEAESADKMIAKAEEKHSEKLERDGRTFYRPQEKEDVPQNVLMHRVDDTTVEISTDGYAFLPDRNVTTEGLQDAWAKTPDDAIRLAIDLLAAKDLVSEAVEMGKQNFAGSPMEAQANAFLGLVDNMKNVRLSIDLSGENLITLQATGVDEAQATELQGGLDALLGMGKMGAQAQVTALKERDPEAAAVLAQIVDAMKANREGEEVSVTIPHPEGLEELAAKFAPMLGMFGGGPPPMAQEEYLEPEAYPEPDSVEPEAEPALP